MQLMSEDQWKLAQDSMRLLRAALSQAEKPNGSDAASAKKALDAQLEATKIAVSAVKNSAEYHQGCKSLVAEFDRVQGTVERVSTDLGKQASYRGRRRSLMTLKEKSEYVRQFGSEAFEKLPN